MGIFFALFCSSYAGDKYRLFVLQAHRFCPLSSVIRRFLFKPLKKNDGIPSFDILRFAWFFLCWWWERLFSRDQTYGAFVLTATAL
jgi:hypothetical protein